MPQARTYESSLGIHYFFQSTCSLQRLTSALITPRCQIKAWGDGFALKGNHTPVLYAKCAVRMEVYR